MKLTLYECEIVKDDEETQVMKEKRPFEKYKILMNQVPSKKKLQIGLQHSEDSIITQ